MWRLESFGELVGRGTARVSSGLRGGGIRGRRVRRDPGGGCDPRSEGPERAGQRERGGLTRLLREDLSGPEPAVAQPPGFFHGGQSVVREQL